MPRGLIWLSGLMFFQMSAFADQSVTLNWNPSSDPAAVGYRIHYGTISHQYAHVVTVGNLTSATIGGLAGGATYYFAATTYDAQNAESDFSNEADYTVPLASDPSLPLVKNVVMGQNVTFSAALGGATGLHYQWSLNSNIVAAATNSTLTLNNVTAAQAGTYSVTITGNIGLTSNLTATLTPAVYAHGQCSFNIAGTPGYQYIVQASTNLGNWIPLQTNTAPFTFVDANAGQFQQRFYRTLILTNSPVSLVASLTVSTNATATLTQAAYANGQYSVKVAGLTGSQYVVQASTNLVDWVPLETNAAPFTFVDPNAGQFKARFYRTVALINSSIASTASLTVSANTAPTFSRAAYANGHYSFIVAGTTGYQYIVQASTNLVDWVPLQTNAAPFSFVDPNASQFKQRFYRAL